MARDLAVSQVTVDPGVQMFFITSLIRNQPDESNSVPNCRCNTEDDHVHVFERLCSIRELEVKDGTMRQSVRIRVLLLVFAEKRRCHLLGINPSLLSVARKETGKE